MALDHLNRFLAEKDTILLARSNELLSDIRSNWSNSFFESDSVLSAWDRNAQTNFELIQRVKTQWLQGAVSKTDSTDVEWAVKNARIIKQFVETAIGGVYEGRDKAMAENIEWILEQRSPQTKAMVWAHDSHISRGEAPQPGNNYFFGQSMGSYLSNVFQDDYYALGLFTYSGSCLGTISYSNFTQVPFEIYTSPEGTLDEGLHRIAKQQNQPYLMLNLQSFKMMSQKMNG